MEIKKKGSQYADEPLNPINDDEETAGPAVGMEQRLDRSIGNLLRALLSGNSKARTKTVIEHNQRLLNDTGPVRTTDNRHQRRGKSRVKIE